MIEFIQKAGILGWSVNGETVEIQAWGRSGIRVRATRLPQIKPDWISALLPLEQSSARVEFDQHGAARIQNGSLVARVSPVGEISFLDANSGNELLQEKPIHALSIPARAYKDLKGDLFHIECGFESYEGEHLFGLGQHLHGRLDQKGCVIELIQRNTEVSIPFMISSRGYGFLWNNPAVGRVELGYNTTRWVAEAAPQIDYWVTAADTPAEILSNYADATGHATEFPEWASGFWQSRLRYASQNELTAVAAEYNRRGLPLSVIVIDFFHWTRQGEWQFDPKYWPDPARMVEMLQKMGTKVMISVWPTVNRLSPNYQEMWSKSFLIRNVKGTPAQMYFVDNGSEDGIYMHYYDSTHPGARKYIWEKVRQGYFQYGIKIFWLDACEPEIIPMMPENLRFYAGDGEAVMNVYPMNHVQGFYEGMRAEGEEKPLLLCRSAWAGSQRYGAAVWSGDVPSTFDSFRAQVTAGLNMGLSGIPWWTSDIGGFRGGDPSEPGFRELLIRWFQFGAFCPLFRLHGHRLPNKNDFGGGDNEVWSFGEDAYKILKQYLFLRERLRPYIQAQMQIAHEAGLPPMRPLWVDFSNDQVCYSVEDAYLFGSDLLVAPVLNEGMRNRKTYLPAGSTWKDAWTGQVFTGGQWLQVDAPLDQIPLFLRGEADLPIWK